MDQLNHDDKDIPRYVCIRESLRAAIDSGGYPLGSRVPSETELARKHGVSRMTARRAILNLVSEGLLYRRSGSGTFVTRPKLVRKVGRLKNLYEEMEEKRFLPISSLLELRRIPADRSVTAALEIDHGEDVIYCRRLRNLIGEPVALHEAYVPYRRFPELLEHTDLEQKSLHRIYEERGLKLAGGRDRINAVMPNREQAEHLAIQGNVPLLMIERITFTEDGLPIEFVRIYVRGDQRAYEVELIR
jgi:GntR family transcriptional regulator